jgi:hypothetical protein
VFHSLVFAGEQDEHLRMLLQVGDAARQLQGPQWLKNRSGRMEHVDHSTTE